MIENLREQLFILRKKRDEVILEKGLVAQDNNDLRENAAFEYLEQQERILTIKILALTQEISESVKISQDKTK